MCFTANDDYQNFLVFVPALCSLTLGSNKEVTNWPSTRISFSKVKPFNINLNDMYLVHGKVILKFNNSVLVQKKSSSLFSNFILILYKVYELIIWPHNPTNNFPLKNCLFVTVKLTINAIKSKFIFNGWGIAFDGESSWNFGDDFARNVVVFGVNKSLSSHISY